MMFIPGPEARDAYMRQWREERRARLIEAAVSWAAGAGVAIALLLIHGALR